MLEKLFQMLQADPLYQYVAIILGLAALFCVINSFTWDLASKGNFHYKTFFQGVVLCRERHCGPEFTGQFMNRGGGAEPYVFISRILLFITGAFIWGYIFFVIVVLLRVAFDD